MLKKYESPGSQIPTELIQAGGGTFNNSWNKEELHDQRKESIIVPFHKKGDKIDGNNFREMSLLSTSLKVIPYICEITGDHQCGYQSSRPITDQIYAFVRYWRKNGSLTTEYISFS
jgi:hypothetical protein